MRTNDEGRMIDVTGGTLTDCCGFPPYATFNGGPWRCSKCGTIDVPVITAEYVPVALLDEARAEVERLRDALASEVDGMAHAASTKVARSPDEATAAVSMAMLIADHIRSGATP